LKTSPSPSTTERSDSVATTLHYLSIRADIVGHLQIFLVESPLTHSVLSTNYAKKPKALNH